MRENGLLNYSVMIIFHSLKVLRFFPNLIFNQNFKVLINYEIINLKFDFILITLH